MLFNSYIFIFAFLPVTLVVFYWLGGQFSPRIAKAWLVGASLFYYGWWNPAYLGILLGSMLINYSFGLALSGASPGLRKKQILILGVVLNVAALGWFKYANFFVDNINQVGGLSLHMERIILPLAISFFTFQQIAYLIDASRGETKEYRFLDYCLFVSFFPQLIAGPIVHHKEMMPQFAKPETYRVNWEHLAVGMTLFCFGLFKKVMIGDSIGEYSTRVFSAAADPSTTLGTLDAWGGALAYTFQLYFDFSGYSDMAIGLARMFGILLPMNFFSPYQSAGIIEFWRRWHITLSRFLRDYLYIPLGGNRKGPGRRAINLFLTMAIGGLWHGAGWTFVIWGALHGFYLLVNHLWVEVRGVSAKAVADRIGRFSGWMIFTFVITVFGWVFFRSPDVETAFRMLDAMFGFGVASEKPLLKPQIFVSLSLLLLAVWFLPNTMEVMRHYQPTCNPEMLRPPAYRWHAKLCWQPNKKWAVLVAFLFVVCVLSLSKVSEFLYFQF